MREIRITFKVDPKSSDALDRLKVLEHHIDRLVDLDGWSDVIKSIHAVKVDYAEVTEADLYRAKHNIVNRFSYILKHPAYSSATELIKYFKKICYVYMNEFIELYTANKISIEEAIDLMNKAYIVTKDFIDKNMNTKFDCDPSTRLVFRIEHETKTCIPKEKLTEITRRWQD